MRAIIIHDQMEIEFRRGFAVDFLKESDELLVSMARHAVPDHLAVEHTEGGKQSGRSMADVIMRHRSTAAFLQRETGLGSVEGLDLAFFVQTQNQRLVWRIQIQPYDIAQLLNELFVAAEFEGADQVRLQVVLLPDPTDGRFTQILYLGHSPSAPMRRIRRLGVESRFDHGFNFPPRDFRNATRPWRVFFQAGQSQSQKPLSPQLHGGARDPQFAGDVLTQRTGGRHLNDFGTLHEPRWKASATRPRLQNTLFLGGQDDGLCCPAHQTIAYALNSYMSS